MHPLTSEKQFDTLITSESDFMLFKNSSTCSISGGACKEVYTAIENLGLDNIYKLEVLEQTELKYTIAEKVGVKHESPQLLIFKKGKLIAFANHAAITQSWIQSML